MAKHKPDPLFSQEEDDTRGPTPPTSLAAQRAERVKRDGPTRRQLRAKLAELTEEYRMLGGEASAGSGAALQRRMELAREMRSTSELLFLREPDVEVTVPRSTTGHPFVINEKKYHPGKYVVKASVAQTLLHMIDQNRKVELDRLRQNGTEIDLGTIGEKAKYAEINREI